MAFAWDVSFFLVKLCLWWSGKHFFFFCPCVTAALWFTFFSLLLFFLKQSHIFSHLPPPSSGLLLLLSVHLAQAKYITDDLFFFVIIFIFFLSHSKRSSFRFASHSSRWHSRGFQNDAQCFCTQRKAPRLKHFSMRSFTSCHLRSRWQSWWLMATDVVAPSGHNPHKDDLLPLLTNSQFYLCGIIFHQQQECGRAPSTWK